MSTFRHPIQERLQHSLEGRQRKGMHEHSEQSGEYVDFPHASGLQGFRAGKSQLLQDA